LLLAPSSSLNREHLAVTNRLGCIEADASNERQTLVAVRPSPSAGLHHRGRRGRVPLAKDLKQRSGGTNLRVPRHAVTSDADGWYTVIGNLHKHQARLEIWLDRFSGYKDRKLYAGFHSEERRRLIDITRRAAKTLGRHRVVTLRDIREGKYFILAERLGRSEFNFPVLEKWDHGMTYYGIFDPTRQSSHRVSPHFCTRAAGFFESVARTLPLATPENDEREVFPQIENDCAQISEHESRI